MLQLSNLLQNNEAGKPQQGRSARCPLHCFHISMMQMIAAVPHCSSKAELAEETANQSVSQWTRDTDEKGDLRRRG